MLSIKIRHIIIFIYSVLLICSCNPYEDNAQERSQKAISAGRNISIGIVDSSLVDSSLFVQGVNMAIEEINENGGIMGKRLFPVFYDDEGSSGKGEQIAKKISANTNIVAVIGHRFSDVAIPASITYEKNGVLFISPGATDQDLIREGSQFIFRNIPSDEIIGKEAADFVDRNGYDKIVILFDSESVGKRISEIFHEHVDKAGIKIIAEKAYAGWQTDFRPMIAEIIKKKDFKAIFIGGVLPSAGILIKQLREMGVTVPVIGSELLDSPQLFRIAGKKAEDTIVSTVFDPKHPKTSIRNFVKDFKKKYSYPPDTWAAQGYDAVKLLAYAIEEGGSPEPIVVSNTLRLLTDWEGATGTYSFQNNGNIINKLVFFKKVKDGNFNFLERDLRASVNPFEVIEDITLRIPVPSPVATIDPGLTEDILSIEITEQLFLGLTDFEPNTYEVKPELATEWTISNDGIKYTFKMRQDVKWTDGKPVTAHDIVWAVQRNLKPETQCPYVSMMYILKNAKAVNEGEMDPSKIGVKAVDDFTIEFELEYPAVYFPGMAGLWVFRPLPREAIEKFDDNWTNPNNIQTNGSYRLAAWEKGMVLILRRNPRYIQASKVAIPEVRYYIIPESSTGLAMYKNDQLDIMGDNYLPLPLNEIPNIMGDPVLSNEYYQEPSFCTYAFGFNTKRPPVDNPLVRQAIAAAIDKKLLIQLIIKGSHEPAYTFTRPPIFGSVSPKDDVGIKFNPSKAKKLLAEAGYPDGKNFPEITLLFNESESHFAIANAVKTFLKTYLNINIKLKSTSWEKYWSERKQPTTPHMYRYTWCADYPDANNWLNELFHPKNSSNIIGWDNAEFEELMDIAAKDSDPKIRKQCYKRAEEILCEEECAWVPIYFESANYMVKSRVKGWYNMALGGQHIRNWYLEE